MQIEYEKTGFREETKPGQRGQTCPHCGGKHMVLPPDSNGVVMHCGGKPVARVREARWTPNAGEATLFTQQGARNLQANLFLMGFGTSDIVNMKSDQPQARDIVQKQAENLVQRVLSQVRHEDYPHSMERPVLQSQGHEREEKREVQIGNQIIALIGIIRDVSSPESRQHAYDQITTLAQELVDMHGEVAKPADAVS